MIKLSPRLSAGRILIAAVVLLPLTATAQDGPVTVVKSDDGAFGMQGSEGVWVQRLVTVRNTGTANLDTKVACLADVQGKGEQVFSRIVSLPAGTERRVELAVRPGLMAPYTPGGAVGPHSTETDYDRLEERYAVWDFQNGQNGKKLTAGSFPIMRVRPQRMNLGVIPGDLDITESYVYLKDSSDENLKDISLVGTRGHNYATRWYGYSIVRIVALSDPDVSRISASQMQALLDWVRRGGVLVIAGAHRLPEALGGELGEAAGTVAVGVHYVTRMRVSGIEIGKLADANWRYPIPMAELSPSSAQVLHECNGLPLLTRKALGDGWVFTLGAPLVALQGDPEPNQSSPLPRVWGSIRKVFSDLPAIRSDDFLKGDAVRAGIEAQVRARDANLGDLPLEERQNASEQLEDLRFSASPASSVLRSISGRKAPPRWVPVGVLVAMAAVALVGGMMLRLRRRGELLWLLLVPGALVVAAVLYAAGLSQTTPERLSFVGLVTGLGDGRTRVQEVYRYYSGPESRTLDFSAGCEDGLMMDVGQVQGGSVGFSETRTGPEVFLPDQSIGINADRALYVDGMVSGLGFQPVLTFDGKGLAGTIRNDLGFDLADAVIYVNGRTYGLGNVPQGAAAVSVGPGQRLGLVEFVKLQQSYGGFSAIQPSPAPAPPPAAPTPPARGRGSAAPAARGRGAAAPATPAPVPSEPAPTLRDTVYQAHGEFTPNMTHSTVDTLRNRLLGALASASEMGRTVQEAPVLVGYGSKTVLDPLKDRPTVTRQGWTAVVWPVRIESPGHGMAVKVPSGFTRVEYGSRLGGPYDSRVRVPEISGGALTVLLRATPPAAVGGLKDATARLTILAHAAGFRLTVSGVVAATGKEKAIQSVDRPQGTLSVAASGAEEFFSAAEGAYVFSLEFRRLGGDGGENLMMGNTFDGADVDLEGTTR